MVVVLDLCESSDDEPVVSSNDADDADHKNSRSKMMSDNNKTVKRQILIESNKKVCAHEFESKSSSDTTAPAISDKDLLDLLLGSPKLLKRNTPRVKHSTTQSDDADKTFSSDITNNNVRVMKRTIHPSTNALSMDSALHKDEDVEKKGKTGYLARLIQKDSNIEESAVKVKKTKSAPSAVTKAQVVERDLILTLDSRCAPDVIQSIRDYFSVLAPPLEVRVEVRTGIEGLCSWKRRSIQTSSQQSEPFVVVIYPAALLLQHVLSDPDAIEFPALRSVLSGLQLELELLHMPAESRIAFLVLNMKRSVDDVLKGQLHGKSGGSLERMTVQNALMEAKTWLAVEHQVECVFFEGVPDLVQHMATTSVLLGKAPFTKPLNDLEDVSTFSLKQKKQQAIAAQDPRILHKAVWETMLMQISGISAAKARRSVSHVDASCPKVIYELLMQEQAEHGVASARERLRYVFSNREEKGLAARVYDALMLSDPDAIMKTAEEEIEGSES